MKYLGVRRGTWLFQLGELNIATFKDFDIDSNVACLIDTEARVIPVIQQYSNGIRIPTTSALLSYPHLSRLLHYDVNVETTYDLPAYLDKVPVETFCQW